MAQLEIFNLHPLFEDVQLGSIFADDKTFVDCLLKYPLEEIAKEYQRLKDSPGFSLREFVLSHFDPPAENLTHFVSDRDKGVLEDAETLWNILTRQPDTGAAGSLIPLPFPYVVPGGRFREIYYWDSYFTSLGLRVSGKIHMVESMVRNFSHLIDTIGYIPNGNRTYYLGRSQPPFYALMVELLAEDRGEEILPKHLAQLEREYGFWMRGARELDDGHPSAHHSVRMPRGEVLNRYWDENDTARPESFQDDVELSHQSDQEPSTLFRHLRAAAESGWDFSSRWFKDGHSLSSIHTTEIVPVDLNCLLLNLERTIAEACRLAGNAQGSQRYETMAKKREAAIQNYCWNDVQGFYFDYDFSGGEQKGAMTLGGVFPLFFRIATDDQAGKVAQVIKDKFLMPGGVVSTLETTGQQWDAPNGWAPLHWITIIGLENYGHQELAADIAQRWVKLNSDVFKRTGKLMEKYNVVDTHLEAGGGEYPGQDGFGWTNCVLLALNAPGRRKALAAAELSRQQS
jgi:alpha,alpha-trehalase